MNLIINADDFGLTKSCSLAIAEAFGKNLISSTTACANGDYIKEAILLAREKGFENKIGVHLNITEGKPLTGDIKNDSFFCEGGEFHGKINRYKKPTEAEILHFKKEISAQIERIKELGVEPTHIDSHHHIHTAPYLINTVKEVAREYGINKIRIHRNVGKIKFYKKFGKTVFNNRLTKDGFITVKKFGSIEDFISDSAAISKYDCEIMVHPDYDNSGNLIDRVETNENENYGRPLSAIKDIVKDKSLISYGEL